VSAASAVVAALQRVDLAGSAATHALTRVVAAKSASWDKSAASFSHDFIASYSARSRERSSSLRRSWPRRVPAQAPRFLRAELCEREQFERPRDGFRARTQAEQLIEDLVASSRRFSDCSKRASARVRPDAGIAPEKRLDSIDGTLAVAEA